MSLNPNQKLSLQVTLRLLERNVREIKRLLSKGERGILYGTVVDLPDESISQLTAACDAVCAEIEMLAQKFSLAPSTDLLARRASGLLTQAWASLEEVGPAKLNRYGMVDPDLEEDLGPQIEKLIRTVLAMARLCGNR